LIYKFSNESKFSVNNVDSIDDDEFNKNNKLSAKYLAKGGLKKKFCRSEDGFFKCDNGFCIPRDWVRDLESDCTYYKGFDEKSSELKK